VKLLHIALNNNLSTVVGKGLSQTVLVPRCFFSVMLMGYEEFKNVLDYQFI